MDMNLKWIVHRIRWTEQSLLFLHRLQRDMEQWNDISRLLTESVNWIRETRRIEHDWKIHSLEQQITKTEVGDHAENIVEQYAIVL